MIMIQHWPNGAGVYFDPRGCVLPTADVVASLEYILWLIRERTAVNLWYAGETNQHHIDGAIVLKFATWEEFQEYEGYEDYQKFMSVRGIAARTGWSGQPYINSRVLINASWVKVERGIDYRLMRTLSHEMWHNLGLGHLNAPHALMNKTLSALSPVDYNVTLDDFMPVQRGGDQRFCVLNRENDIFIPRINGMMADLKYIGDGSIHKWRLRSLRDAGPHQVESAVTVFSLEQPDLTFTDVRSPTMLLTRAELEYDIATEIWTLKHAS